jgi:hypothetical protein
VKTEVAKSNQLNLRKGFTQTFGSWNEMSRDQGAEVNPGWRTCLCMKMIICITTINFNRTQVNKK